MHWNDFIFKVYCEGKENQNYGNWENWRATKTCVRNNKIEQGTNGNCWVVENRFFI